MLSIVHSCKVKEFLHIPTDIFPLFPHHSNFYADRWIKGNSCYPRICEPVSHAGVKEAAIFSGSDKLQCGINLTAAHDDVRSVAVHFEASP